MEVDLNLAAPLPVALLRGLNRSPVKLRGITLSPVEKDCTDAIARTGRLLGRRQCANIESMQQLPLTSLREYNLLRALAPFSSLRSLSLTR